MRFECSSTNCSSLLFLVSTGLFLLSSQAIKGILITIEKKKHEPHLAYSHFMSVYVHCRMSINSMNQTGGSVINVFLDQLDPMDFFAVLSFSLTKAFASIHPGMLSLPWCSCQGSQCDIQYFCYPSLQSHLHLTPDICIMASLHLLSSEIKG